ncbi:hypothetical protein HHK36_007061 [Tetracentron sinense]|uniref:Ribosomal protein eL8/eL30/eS12/Gadd45 domain-containing protein n=1 Tax=Tetracentron sinense TaxID=13715 RepID=A0A835DLA0_TETSI|nr:hypothetical protein HHK36_007061 [Tetracentron sinense]
MGSDSEAEKSLKDKKKMQALAPIAKPLAGKKLCKRTLKLVRKGFPLCIVLIYTDTLSALMRIVWSMRLCIIAGNISPIDVITHVPVLCEEADIPYVYVPSKEDLVTAGATKRPTCCVLILTKPTKGELGQEEQEKLKADYAQVVSDLSEITSSLF